MKKIIMASLCMITLNGFAGIDYQTKAKCQADIQHYIDVSDELPVDLSMDYWQWFEAFLRSESKKTSACEGGVCNLTIITGGCDSVTDPIAFALMKPQLEEELIRLKEKRQSLKEVKNTINCQYPEGQDPSIENCGLS